MNKYDKIAAPDNNTGLQVQKRTKTEQEISAIIKTSVDLECDINPEDRLEEDLGLDSLEYAELLTELEKHYQISISDREADKIKTFGQLVNAVDKHLANSREPKVTKPIGKTEYSAEQIEGLVLNLVSEACDTCDVPVTIDSHLSEDLECDSLDIFEILIRCEDEFNVSLTMTYQEQKKLVTVSDIVNLVKLKKLGSA